MKKIISAIIAATLLAGAFAGCAGNNESKTSEATTVASSEAASKTEAVTEAATEAATSASNEIGTVSNTLASDKDALISTLPSKFRQVEYTDSETGLSVTYNLYLPDNYDESMKYPTVVFIADSSVANGNSEASLTQGLGALVWASNEWQSVNETIVINPTYPETILDDRNGYSTTEYVELTKRLIDDASTKYAVDTNRIYGTGQSMGCMTTLILASEYPDLYAACMFVDGQWDVSALKNLEKLKFVYFAAEDDTSAFTGMSEVMQMFDTDGVKYTYQQWNGGYTPDELTAAAKDLFAADNDANFVSWTTGTIEAGGGSMGGGMGGSVAYHMASFDYAYNCVAVMEWLFQQTK